MKTYLGLILLFVTTLASANEVRWWQLETKFSYKDLSTFCEASQFPRSMFLSTEIEGNTIIRAVLWNNPPSAFTQGVCLSPSEISKTKLQTGADNAVWIRQLHLEARTINWLFFHAGDATSQCHPSSHLATLGPNSFAFNFMSEDEPSIVGSYDSNVGRFSGTLKTGGHYQASLWFTQKQRPAIR